MSSPFLTSVASVSSVSPTSGSVYGGVTLTVNGNGFTSSRSNIQVFVGTNTCPIIQTTPGQVTCTVPAQGSSLASSTVRVVSNGVTFPSSLVFTYSSSLTPSVSLISPTTGTTGQSITITGSNFVSGQTTVTVGGVPCVVNTVSANSITCVVGSSPAGNQPVVVSVSSNGASNNNVVFQYTLQVNSATPLRGSFGGGQSVTINGNGFNSSGVSVTVCGTACQSVNVISNTQLICITPSSTASSSDRSCSLTVSAGSLSQSVTYVYGNNVTPTISSVSPVRGGTGGGTLLTITGTNFP